MNSLPQELDGLLGDPLATGRRRAAAGQRVVGLTSSDVPVELIVAAGAFALALPISSGATSSADAYLEASFSPAARSLTEQWLAGAFDFMDAVVFPRSNDSLQRIYYYLCELQRRNLARGPRPLLFDVAKIPRHTSLAHTRAATRQLAEALRTDLSALSDALSRRNRRRRLMNALLAQRRSVLAPPGPLAERITRAADVGDPDLFDATLARWLATPQPVWSGPRLLLAGSPPPDERLHMAAEEAGARVVDEFGDHAVDRWGSEIPATADALDALADHHASLRAGGRSFEDRPAALIARARAAHVDGVVLWIIEQDESLVWDVPAMKTALEREKIPLLELSRRAWSDDARVPIAQFIRQLGGAK